MERRPVEAGLARALEQRVRPLADADEMRGKSEMQVPSFTQ